MIRSRAALEELAEISPIGHLGLLAVGKPTRFSVTKGLKSRISRFSPHVENTSYAHFTGTSLISTAQIIRCRETLKSLGFSLLNF
jgi:hypothetical protein